MKSIFLFTLSYLILTPSCVLAMEPEPSKALVIATKKDVTELELEEYIKQGFEKSGVPKEACVFAGFIKKLNDPVFYNTNKTVDSMKNKKKAFEDLQNKYIKVVANFSVAFDDQIKGATERPFKVGIQRKALHLGDLFEQYPNHEPYYRTFQNVTNQFLAIRQDGLGTPLTADFEILENKENDKLAPFVFKAKDEYVPLCWCPRSPISNICALYGPQLVPLKQFTFFYKELVKDSGIVLAPSETFVKLSMQFGEKAEHPFTGSPVTFRMAYDADLPLMTALKSHYGAEKLAKDFHFMTMPITQEEGDILELLFLEELLVEKNSNSLSIESQKYLTWIESEEKGSVTD